ncbi:aldose epimerase family protein [Rapidithrix thailandica]|uniref:Aldose 1-epimerase n=1 Tax=Rapidithrix thailandica TaxID=413964 RepID=A0AAW9S0P1_9BACT
MRAKPIATIQKTSWGNVRGKEVFLFTLTNTQGLKAEITNYGGIWVSLFCPDRNGQWQDIVWGRDSLEAYQEEHPFLGAIVGRYANRIAKGECHIDNQIYKFAVNNGPNHLHGGLEGFDKAVWDAKIIQTEEYVGLQLYHLSQDGEEGYPGNLSLTVEYIFTNQNELKIHYRAKTDKTTVVNLTNHAYFNLKGQGSILDHKLQLNARFFTPCDETAIPTGEIKSVRNSPMDFTQAKRIGNDIEEEDLQLRHGKGYDHNFVLNKPYGVLGLAAILSEESTGRKVMMHTTEPGLQVYTGNWLEGTKVKNQQVLKDREGIALEAQHYPDSPNKPHFPSTVLTPGKEYHQTTVYQFLVESNDR